MSYGEKTMTTAELKAGDFLEGREILRIEEKTYSNTDSIGRPHVLAGMKYFIAFTSHMRFVFKEKPNRTSKYNTYFV